MRIGLLSDTHIPEVAREVPPQVAQAFEGVDLILHGGDIYARSVLEQMAQVAPVLAAEGDDDYGETLRDDRVEKRHRLTVEGRQLWLVHERPYFFTLPSAPGEEAQAGHADGVPDIVVFGHEHRVVLQRSNDVLYVSPGSPTLLHYHRGLGTAGIIDISPEGAEVVIWQLEAEGLPPQVVAQAAVSFADCGVSGHRASAQALLHLPDEELDVLVAERVMGWCPTPDPGGADSSPRVWRDSSGECCPHPAFCADPSASIELNRRMEALGWHYEWQPTHPGNEGPWGYGIAFSSREHWVGLGVDCPSQIRRARCVLAILALEMAGGT